MRKYERNFPGFDKRLEGQYIFGPRVARAVIIRALTGGPEFIYKEGVRSLPFSYRELKTLWPEAVRDAVVGVTIDKKLICSGIGALFDRIESVRAGEHDDGHFDEARKIAKHLNLEVFGEVCVFRAVHVRKPPIIEADGSRWAQVPYLPRTIRRA